MEGSFERGEKEPNIPQKEEGELIGRDLDEEEKKALREAILKIRREKE